MKRYKIEFGLGTNFHGQDVSHKAEKAVKNAYLLMFKQVSKCYYV
ncbi:Lin0512 family protein [Clostridium algoriphilum]|nr:Lin0512 family protein [Clostridium algoriphilum]